MEIRKLAGHIIMQFLDGAVKEVSEEALSKGRVLDVRWRGNVHFVLQTYHSDWGWYFAERNGERVSSLYRVGRRDASKNSLCLSYTFRVDGRNDDLFYTCYCSECFNGHDFKSLEWVKVKPKFCERKYRGRLIEDEEIWHDLEGEFIKGMKKYSIPYEAEDGMYIVYGYR